MLKRELASLHYNSAVTVSKDIAAQLVKKWHRLAEAKDGLSAPTSSGAIKSGTARKRLDSPPSAGVGSSDGDAGVCSYRSAGLTLLEWGWPEHEHFGLRDLIRITRRAKEAETLDAGAHHQSQSREVGG